MPYEHTKIMRLMLISLIAISSIGIKGFLMKPVVRSELGQAVRNILDEAKGQNQD